MNDLALGLNVTHAGAECLSESHSTPQNAPGAIARVRCVEGDRVFRYMKAEEAIAVGQCVMRAALLDNADVDQTQATTTNILYGSADFTASEFISTFPDAYVTIDAGTGIGQTRYIMHNRGSTSYLTLAQNWAVALDTTSDFVTYSINYVSLLDTDDISEDAAFCAGVAISAVTDEQWAWFQVGGFCPKIRAVGSTDAIVKGEGIVPSSTEGACKGHDSTMDAADALTVFGEALHAYAGADSATQHIAAIINCRFTNI